MVHCHEQMYVTANQSINPLMNDMFIIRIFRFY